MITVTKGKNYVKTFPNNDIFDVCMHYAWGGYTAPQVAAAMVALRKLIDGKPGKINGFKIAVVWEY